MSAEAMAIALHHSRAGGVAKLVLLGIANHDGDGGAWPSVATLAIYAGGVTPRAVQQAIDHLEKLHEIRRIVQGGGTRETPDYRRPNLYEVLLTCPTSCDRSKQHRVTGRSLPVELGELSTGVKPASPGELSTGVKPASPGGVKPASPEPVQGNRDNSGLNSATEGRRTVVHNSWDHACVDGKMTTHRISRKTGACAYCGARRTRYELEE